MCIYACICIHLCVCAWVCEVICICMYVCMNGLGWKTHHILDARKCEGKVCTNVIIYFCVVSGRGGGGQRAELVYCICWSCCLPTENIIWWLVYSYLSWNEMYIMQSCYDNSRCKNWVGWTLGFEYWAAGRQEEKALPPSLSTHTPLYSSLVRQPAYHTPLVSPPPFPSTLPLTRPAMAG